MGPAAAVMEERETCNMNSDGTAVNKVDLTCPMYIRNMNFMLVGACLGSILIEILEL